MCGTFKLCTPWSKVLVASCGQSLNFWISLKNICSLGFIYEVVLFHCARMKSSTKYKSPSKTKRDTQRLLAYLFKTIHKKTLPTLKPTLKCSPVTSTNYPEPCLACRQNQCEYDHNHGIYFNLKLAFEEQLENIWKKKPPDDACGLLVATNKEPEEASF